MMVVSNERIKGPPPTQNPNVQAVGAAAEEEETLSKIDTLLQGMADLQQVHEVLVPAQESCIQEKNRLEADLKKKQALIEEIHKAMTTFGNEIFLPEVLDDSFLELQVKQREALTKALLNLEKKSHAEISKVDAQLDALHTRMEVYRGVLRNGVKEYFKESPPQHINFCSICVTDASNVAIVPCGHTFCEGCIEKMESSRCPGCRTTIEKKLKIQNL